jgi:hypothetical protein
MKKSSLKLRIETISFTIITLTLSAFFCLRTTLSNDATIYYSAGEAVQNGLSPWNNELNPFEQYLYGPIHGLALGLFSNLSPYFFVLLVKTLSCIALIIACLTFLNNKREALVVYCLVILTFSFRSNIQYGAIGGLASVVAICLLYPSVSGKQVPRMFGQILLLDFKPHIYWFTFLYRSTRIRLTSAIISASAIYLLIYFVNAKLSLFDWIETLTYRKDGLDQDPTLISPSMMILGRYIPPIYLFLLSFILVVAASIVAHRGNLKKEENFVLIYGTVLLSTPYLHTIDTLGLSLLLLIVIQRTKQKSAFIVILTLFNMIWSNSLILNLAFGLIAISLMIYAKWKVDFKIYAISYFSYVLINVIWFNFLQENYIPNSFFAFVLTANVLVVYRLTKIENANLK